MKSNIAYLIAFLAFFAFSVRPVQTYAQQQDEGPDIFERAEMEADRLQRMLELEDWQVFYVDSTLKHDYPAMIAESEALRESKVANSSMYQAVADILVYVYKATNRTPKRREQTPNGQ